MRMLQVSEEKAAIGFRRDYVLPATKKAAMHMLDNAVCPQVEADVLDALRRAA
jgi:DNA (cytosine-5)-methyltransferase 1